jgi:hypothetical protein
MRRQNRIAAAARAAQVETMDIETIAWTDVAAQPA